MAITRAQRQRPAVKNHRRGQRVNTRRYPPEGVEWGQEGWGEGGAVSPPTTSAANYLWEVSSFQLGLGKVSSDDPVVTDLTLLLINKQDDDGQPYSLAGVTGGTITLGTAGGPLAYTVEGPVDGTTYAGTWGVPVAYASGTAPAPADGAAITVTYASGAATAFDPTDHTIDEVKAHVNGLAMDDERDDLIQAIIDIERVRKNRSTLVTWLDQQLGVV